MKTKSIKSGYLLLLGVWFLISTCSRVEVTPPPFDPETNLEGTLPIADTIMRSMEGIYTLSAGSGPLGEQFVCKVSKRRVSFFSNRDGIFIILKFGFNPTDSSIQFAGFWRYSETTDQGNIGFAIAKNEGASDLLQNHVADNIKIQGLFQDIDRIIRSVTFGFSRHFSAFTQTNDFAIFGHHGIQNASGPPYAENSINALLYGEDYGVNGMEYDVRMTKDYVPICVHDPSINTRTTLKGPLSGDYDQYNFSILNDYVRLIDGQKIPSVEQALHTFVASTNLKYMWLDIKGNTDIFKYMEPVVRNAYAEAATLNRNVVIITDLPTEDVITEYHKQPSYADLPLMCELTLQEVIDNGCKYWGPRYSMGLLLDDVDHAHSQGIKVYSWTLNSGSLIQNYLQNGRFDGFISDYPAYIVYYYYTMF